MVKYSRLTVNQKSRVSNCFKESNLNFSNFKSELNYEVFLKPLKTLLKSTCLYQVFTRLINI